MRARQYALLISTFLVGALVGASGCERTTSSIELGELAEIELALTDPGLLDEVNTLVAATFFNPAGYRCADLLEMNAAQLDEVSKAQEPIAGAMAIPARDATGAAGRHGFGGIYAPGEYSFLLLGSFRPFGEYPERGRPLEEAAGTVIAMGCVEALVMDGDRQDIQITLFPAGVR